MKKKIKIVATLYFIEVALCIIDILFLNGAINNFLANNRFVWDDLNFANGILIGYLWFGKEE